MTDDLADSLVLDFDLVSTGEIGFVKFYVNEF